MALLCLPWELIDHAAFSRMEKKRERARHRGRKKMIGKWIKKWSEDSCKKRAVADFVTPHWELTDTEPDGVFNLQISFAHLQWFITFHTHFGKRSFFYSLDLGHTPRTMGPKWPLYSWRDCLEGSSRIAWGIRIRLLYDIHRYHDIKGYSPTAECFS